MSSFQDLGVFCLSKGVTCACRVGLKERKKLLQMLGLGSVKTLSGSIAAARTERRGCNRPSCKLTRHAHNSFGLVSVFEYDCVCLSHL